MLKMLFAVRDIKADYFFSPIVCDNIDVAKRCFADACNNENLPFVKHPEDYALYGLGDYDISKGKIVPNDQPLHLCSAEEMLRHA